MLYEEYDGLEISIYTPPKLSFKMEFTPVEIPIIIDNLLNNSKKAKAHNVNFEWEAVSEKEVKLHVSDNGDGIDKNVIDKIFEFRFSTTRGGSGLGLYHIREVLKKMQGSIKAKTNLSKGAEFIITFIK